MIRGVFGACGLSLVKGAVDEAATIAQPIWSRQAARHMRSSHRWGLGKRQLAARPGVWSCQLLRVSGPSFFLLLARFCQPLVGVWWSAIAFIWGTLEALVWHCENSRLLVQTSSCSSSKQIPSTPRPSQLASIDTHWPPRDLSLTSLSLSQSIGGREAPSNFRNVCYFRSQRTSMQFCPFHVPFRVHGRITTRFP